MSTNSSITIVNDDKTYHGIYVHWDGYPSHVGQVLVRYYNDEAKIRELLALGSLSSLDKDCTAPDGHTFDTPVDGHCVAYTRDRGEDEPMVKSSTFEAHMKYLGQRYNYIFIDGEWKVFTSRNTTMIPVKNFFYDGVWHDSLPEEA